MSNPTGVPTEAELKARSTAPRVTEEALNNTIKKIDYFIHPGSQLTVCIITLLNGYTVTGESACADPANFKQDVGERFALESAKRKIWPLLGYVLKEELYQASLKGQGGTFLDRMKTEVAELVDKRNKLQNFILANETYKDLHKDDQELLVMQLQYMQGYVAVLEQRIAKSV